ncbi:hypothetical protein V9T40_014844 [Parthenolecanium corni]|uniref:Uncharacterized protein n=1 Tax=Parthenolecanium corni TaxID=536013 RepID=A0AAN9T2T8_9HEMI
MRPAAEPCFEAVGVLNTTKNTRPTAFAVKGIRSIRNLHSVRCGAVRCAAPRHCQILDFDLDTSTRETIKVAVSSFCENTRARATDTTRHDAYARIATFQHFNISTFHPFRHSTQPSDYSLARENKKKTPRIEERTKISAQT